MSTLDAKPTVGPRILFASERTLLAWIRTGLSLMGFGFALARFGLYLRVITPLNPAIKPPHFSVSVGFALVGIGVLTNVVATYQHVRVIKRFQSGEVELHPRASPAVILAATLSLLGVGGCLYLLTI